jgi:hypothetical protein
MEVLDSLCAAMHNSKKRINTGSSDNNVKKKQGKKLKEEQKRTDQIELIIKKLQ